MAERAHCLGLRVCACVEEPERSEELRSLLFFSRLIMKCVCVCVSVYCLCVFVCVLQLDSASSMVLCGGNSSLSASQNEASHLDTAVLHTQMINLSKHYVCAPVCVVAVHAPISL